MDTVLFAAWQNKEPPFNGQTLTVKQAVPLETLSNVLTEVVQKLHKTFGGETLYFVMDWHEHDGVVLPAKPALWDVLKSEVETTAQLSRLFLHADTFVRRGFYPESGQFYLRFYVNEPGYAGQAEDEDNGDFDLSVADELAKVIVPVLGERLGNNLHILPANGFFNERMAEHYVGQNKGNQ